jgi:hypothetical protein
VGTLRDALAALAGSEPVSSPLCMAAADLFVYTSVFTRSRSLVWYIIYGPVVLGCAFVSGETYNRGRGRRV